MTNDELILQDEARTIKRAALIKNLLSELDTNEKLYARTNQKIGDILEDNLSRGGMVSEYDNYTGTLWLVSLVNENPLGIATLREKSIAYIITKERLFFNL